jgi:hypothetical protein
VLIYTHERRNRIRVMYLEGYCIDYIAQYVDHKPSYVLNQIKKYQTEVRKNAKAKIGRSE